MKIATYNIWNDEATLELRAEQILREIRSINADIIGLQEVPSESYGEQIGKKTEYPYVFFCSYPGEEEGLAILSRYSLTDAKALYENRKYENSQAIHVFFEVEGLEFSLTNVHLPWDSVRTREKQIVAIDRYIHEQKADFYILLGDFNGDVGSSVDGYLLGDRTLEGCEANPCWNDLSCAYAARTEEKVHATLDTVNNPRWAGKKSIYSPQVMDRIYIMDHWHETTLEKVQIFGAEVSKETGYSASDHYGVIAEVIFSK